MLEYNSFQDEEAFDMYRDLLKKYPGMHINLNKNAKLSVEDVMKLDKTLKDFKEL